MIRHEQLERWIRITGYVTLVLLLHVSIESTVAVSHGVSLTSLTCMRIMTLWEPLYDMAPRFFYYVVGMGSAAIIGGIATHYELYVVGVDNDEAYSLTSAPLGRENTHKPLYVALYVSVAIVLYVTIMLIASFA